MIYVAHNSIQVNGSQVNKEKDEEGGSWFQSVLKSILNSDTLILFFIFRAQKSFCLKWIIFALKYSFGTERKIIIKSQDYCQVLHQNKVYQAISE